jgi:hypothetical protein
VSLLLAVALLATPPDPFADEYLPPTPKEVGAAPGQFRLFAGGGLVHLVPDLALFGALEWMASGWLGVRGTGMVQLTRFGDAPQVVSGRLGPWLHVLPYHRVDLGIFFEGGWALLDVLQSTRSAAPVIAGGGFLDVHVNSYVFIHSQLELDWLVRPGAGHLFSPAGWLGAGLSF